MKGAPRCKAGSIQLAAEQLLLIHRQRRHWQRRLGELLRDGHPDGEIYLSLPGLDVRLAARVLAEVGDGAFAGKASLLLRAKPAGRAETGAPFTHLSP